MYICGWLKFNLTEDKDMSYETIANAIPTMTYEEQVNLMEVLVNAIKAGISRKKTAKTVKKDCKNSYPKGYFDLFGSIDDPTFVEPEELPLSLDKMESF